VGPTGNKVRLRGSLNTTDKDAAARGVANIQKRYWDGYHNGAGAILTFEEACIQFIADGRPTMVGKTDVVQKARDYFKNTLVKDITAKKIRTMTLKLYGHCANISKNRMGIAPVQAVINHCAEQEL